MRPLPAALATTALHALIALALTSPWFFRLNVATSQRVFGRSNGEVALFEDVRAYYRYADRALRGEIPYRDYVVEYPLAAFPLFLLPRLVAPDFQSYRWAFATEMLAFDLWAVWLVARWASDRGRLLPTLSWYTLGFAALGPLTVARFDLAPMALGFAASVAWTSGRGGLGGFLAGWGGLMKLFPMAVAGPWLANRRPWPGCVAMGLTVLGGIIVWAWLGGPGMVASLRYHLGRGLEIESLDAGVLILVAAIRGRPLEARFNHSSVELIADGAAWFATWATVVQAVAILGAVFRSRQTPAADASRWAAACVLSFALFGKVLSPQYLLWLLPFVVTMNGFAGAWARPVYLGAALLTLLVYPWSGGGLMEFAPLAVGLLNLRNAVLVGLLGLLLFAPNANR